MNPTVETGVKRPSSRRLRFLRCFTAVDDEETCSPALEDVAVKETNGGGVGRLSDLRPSSPVTPRQKKRFWIFSGFVESVSPDSSRGFVQEKKKHWRRKRRDRQLSESNNKVTRKQDNLDITNSNKDLLLETNTTGSSSSSLSKNTTSVSSSEADLSSTSSTSSLTSFNLSSTTPCVSKHKTVIDSGLCVLVVSLLVVIMWGKVCAIVCTSTWLCIMFGRPSKPQMSSASDPDEEKTMES